MEHGIPLEITLHEPPILQFSLSEAMALWKFLSHEYISYEDTELLDAVRKLSRFVQANE